MLPEPRRPSRCVCLFLDGVASESSVVVVFYCGQTRAEPRFSDFAASWDPQSGPNDGSCSPPPSVKPLLQYRPLQCETHVLLVSSMGWVCAGVIGAMHCGRALTSSCTGTDVQQQYCSHLQLIGVLCCWAGQFHCSKTTKNKSVTKHSKAACSANPANRPLATSRCGWESAKL